jgi:hypothetical protein
MTETVTRKPLDHMLDVNRKTITPKSLDRKCPYTDCQQDLWFIADETYLGSGHTYVCAYCGGHFYW